MWYTGVFALLRASQQSPRQSQIILLASRDSHVRSGALSRVHCVWYCPVRVDTHRGWHTSNKAEAAPPLFCTTTTNCGGVSSNPPSHRHAALCTDGTRAAQKSEEKLRIATVITAILRKIKALNH